MASFFPGHVSAAQVGTFFLGQYYGILQQQPEFVHQFYTNMSSMVRCDGAVTESATGMLQIHELVMRHNFTAIEVKTAQSLESWTGGVLMLISGYVQLKDCNGRRQFVQTFFLAPQEKGYFVLNDIFQLLEEEHFHHQITTTMPHDHFEPKLNSPSSVPEPVSDYILGERTEDTDSVPPVQVEEDDSVKDYSIPESTEEIPEPDEISDEYPVEEPPVSYSSSINTIRDPPEILPEKPVGEPLKQTYASILRSKGQSAHTIPHSTSLTKVSPVHSDWSYTPQLTPQQMQPTLAPEKTTETIEETVQVEEQGESKSVYVGNLPPSITLFELEQMFKKFGQLRPDGVAIRSRKEVGAYYGFIEYEDAVGVQNALEASPLQLNGRQIYVEERRPNSGASRGRRGRGRGGYHSDAPRGRFGRNYGRGGGQEVGDRDY